MDDVSCREARPGLPAAIRTAVHADEAALRDLDIRVWSHQHAVLDPLDPADPFFDARHRPEDFLVAELPGLPARRLAGYIRTVPATPLPANAHVQQIQGLAVDPLARRHGVARALVRASVEQARQRGARRITLRVLGHNTPARKLYESEGFAVEGVLPEEFLLDGAYVDDVLMGRRL